MFEKRSFLAPFCFYNGNTFVGIARKVCDSIGLKASHAHLLRTYAGHIVAGTAIAQERELLAKLLNDLK